MKIGDENFVTFAMRHYDNPNCSDVDEFMDDLNHVKYVKRLLNRYSETGELKDKLVMNHIVVLYNVFGNAATQMLFHRLVGLESQLKPFLVALNRLPDVVTVGDRTINTTDITMDQDVVRMIRESLP